MVSPRPYILATTTMVPSLQTNAAFFFLAVFASLTGLLTPQVILGAGPSRGGGGGYLLRVYISQRSPFRRGSMSGLMIAPTNAEDLFSLDTEFRITVLGTPLSGDDDAKRSPT